MFIIRISSMRIRIIIIIYYSQHNHDNANKHNYHQINNDDKHAGIMIRSNKYKKPYWNYDNVNYSVYENNHRGKNNGRNRN